MTVGHQAILHGCTVGDGALVGMGARVLNGAVIGERCLVGAGALVTEGKIFEPQMLIVGSPARGDPCVERTGGGGAGAVGGALCRTRPRTMRRICSYIADT